jgi:hypothetical protein
VNHAFSQFYEDITLHQETTLESLCLRSLHEFDNDSKPSRNWPFYTTEDGVAEFFALLELPLSETDLHSLQSRVVSELQTVDESVSKSSIEDSAILFSDFDSCTADYINYEVQTEYPHRYFSNVSSVEEYISKAKNISSTSIQYSVPFRIKSSESTTNVFSDAEQLLKDETHQAISTTRDWMYEGERIQIHGDDTDPAITVFLRVLCDETPL